MLYRDYLKDKYQSTALKTAYAEGFPCVLESSKGKNIRNYEVYGNSVQDGVPTPESPVEIQSVGDLVTDTESEYYGKYDIPITVCGKNLLPYPYIYTTKTINGVTFTDNGDGSITIDGTATANAVFYLVGKQDNYTLDKCGLKIGDRYTISKNLVSGDSIANIYFTANYYNASGSMKQGALATSTNTATSTIQSDFKVWGMYLLVLKDKTVNNTTIELQLEKGSSATEYEPYKGRITEHIYLDEPLRKVGEYADYIDFKGQKVVRNTAQTTFNGSERWVKTGDVSSGVYQGFAVSNTIIGAPSGDFECLSDKFPYSSTTKKNIVKLINSAYSLRIIIGSEYVPDLETATFKNWLSENNVKITYPIATPTEENISLPALKTFKGTSIISVDTSVQPSNIKAKYVRL